MRWWHVKHCSEWNVFRANWSWVEIFQMIYLCIPSFWFLVLRKHSKPLKISKYQNGRLTVHGDNTMNICIVRCTVDKVCPKSHRNCIAFRWSILTLAKVHRARSYSRHASYDLNRIRLRVADSIATSITSIYYIINFYSNHKRTEFPAQYSSFDHTFESFDIRIRCEQTWWFKLAKKASTTVDVGHSVRMTERNEYEMLKHPYFNDVLLFALYIALSFSNDCVHYSWCVDVLSAKLHLCET